MKVSGCKSRFVPVPSCSSVHLASDWLKMGHVTQLWPTRSRPERLLGRFSSFLKEEEIEESFCFWHLDVAGKECDVGSCCSHFVTMREQSESKRSNHRMIRR